MNQLFLVALLVLATGTACGRTAATSAAADVITGADGTTSTDTVADTDTSAWTDAVEDVGAADTDTTATPDTADDIADADLPATTDAQVEDAADVELGTPPTAVTWELADPVGAACLAEVATATSDPRPGLPCSQEHELRCTLAGAYEKSIPDRTYCVKPYRVRCALTNQGLRWQAETCNQPPAQCSDLKWNPTSCQENEKGATCCPLEFRTQWPNGGIGKVATLCYQMDKSSLCWLPFTGARESCQFLADPLEQAQLEKEKWEKSTLCGSWCKDCKYWYTTEVCKPVYQMSCPGGGVMGKSFQVCVSLPGQEDRCADNCQDLIDAGYPWEPWNNEP